MVFFSLTRNFVTGSDQEETGREQGKKACDMSAIPCYEWVGFAGHFTSLPQKTLSLKFCWYSRDFQTLEMGLKLSVIVTVCKMYRTKTGVIEYGEMPQTSQKQPLPYKNPLLSWHHSHQLITPLILAFQLAQDIGFWPWAVVHFINFAKFELELE